MVGAAFGVKHVLGIGRGRQCRLAGWQLVMLEQIKTRHKSLVSCVLFCERFTDEPIFSAYNTKGKGL